MKTETEELAETLYVHVIGNFTGALCAYLAHEHEKSGDTSNFPMPQLDDKMLAEAAQMGGEIARVCRALARAYVKSAT